MLILSILCGGIAVALACSGVLRSKHSKAQRAAALRRIVTGTQKQHEASKKSDCSTNEQKQHATVSAEALSKLPFFGARNKKYEQRKLKQRYEAELPRLFDLLAMGMNAGLSFDAAFGLYVERFDTELALVCKERYDLWHRGLISRSSGLEQLAQTLDMPIFDRFSRMASRSIRYGVSMAPLIKEYAHEARSEYRNKQKEKVLKAPVKMLLPTGGLILPAMMMLVIGPIILDVTERMV